MECNKDLPFNFLLTLKESKYGESSHFNLWSHLDPFVHIRSSLVFLSAWFIWFLKAGSDLLQMKLWEQLFFLDGRHSNTRQYQHCHPHDWIYDRETEPIFSLQLELDKMPADAEACDSNQPWEAQILLPSPVCDLSWCLSAPTFS